MRRRPSGSLCRPRTFRVTYGAMPSADAALATLSVGFRHRYLSYDELTRQVRAWAEAFPEVVRLTSIGRTPEGRELWLLTIGKEPDRRRPTVWVDGNMHASELCGSSMALAIAEDAIRFHADPAAGFRDLPAPAARALEDVLFMVLPRMSPDGAEAVLQTGRYVRSVPRDDRPAKSHARWISEDVDGDGLSLLMRVRDPGGEYVESVEVPGLMLPRRIEDEGPFYKLYPEGRIENFDGHTVPSPHFLSDNQTDLNRNFPWSWAPPHEQAGAGAFALSEPEARAVVEHTTRHPEIFAWLNGHTFGGVFIRPLGHLPDNKMDAHDLALFRQIGAWAEDITGYPMVSGFEEFTYEPDKPLHGDLTDYAYHQRGAIAYVVELWDLFTRIGMPRKKRFVLAYSELGRNEMIDLGKWDATHNQGRVVRPWKAVRHAQLGDVEVGGVDPRVGLWNPPYELLPEVCEAQSRAFARVASLAPRLFIDPPEVEPLAEGLFKVTVTVRNTGYLPTYVLSSAKSLEHAEPVRITATGEGLELVDIDRAPRTVGHLDGWGRGLHDGSGALYFQRSRGNTGEGSVTFMVRGHGELSLRAGSCRVGHVSTRVRVG